MRSIRSSPCSPQLCLLAEESEGSKGLNHCRSQAFRNRRAPRWKSPCSKETYQVAPLGFAICLIYPSLMGSLGFQVSVFKNLFARLHSSFHPLSPWPVITWSRSRSVMSVKYGIQLWFTWPYLPFVLHLTLLQSYTGWPQQISGMCGQVLHPLFRGGGERQERCYHRRRDSVNTHADIFL